MRHFILLTLSFLLCSASATAQDTARMSAVVKARFAHDHFMGSALVAKNGTVLFAESAGWANLEWKIAHTPETKFRIGSVTKQFTAACVLLLAERGKLAIDDPLGKFIPSAPEAWKPVTLRQLLSHTGGIPNFTEDPGYEMNRLRPETPAQTMAHLAARPLDFPPGEKYKYSNTGYVLLGWVIEIASGQSYETFLRENIFQPLGMNDSGYDSSTAVIPQRAAGYVPGPKGPANAPYIDMHVPYAAGAIYSTPADLLRWTEALFGGKVLSAASLEQMTTPVMHHYAFGLEVMTDKGRKVISHNGGIEGFNAQLNYYPESKVTVIVLANINGPTCTELANDLSALALGETVTLASERQVVSLPRTTLESYVGTYEIRPGRGLTVTLEGDQLMGQPMGSPKMPLLAEAEGKFFFKAVDAQVEFVKDPAGHITHALLRQRGHETKATRKP